MTCIVSEYVTWPVESVVQSWSLTNLKVLKCTSIRSSHLYLQHTPPLDTLEWDLRGDYLQGANVSFIELLRIVSPSLRRLKIRWFDIDVHELADQRNTPVTLPSLVEFTLIDFGREDDPEAILRLWQCINAPNLVKLDLVCHASMCSTNGFFTWIDSLKNPALKAVDMVLTGDSYYSSDSIRDAILKGTKPGDLAVDVSFGHDPMERFE
jgi:hypothetical protein